MRLLKAGIERNKGHHLLPNPLISWRSVYKCTFLFSPPTHPFSDSRLSLDWEAAANPSLVGCSDRRRSPLWRPHHRCHLTRRRRRRPLLRRRRRPRRLPATHPGVGGIRLGLAPLHHAVQWRSYCSHRRASAFRARCPWR